MFHDQKGTITHAKTYNLLGICEALHGELFKNLSSLSLWIGPFNYESFGLREFLKTPLTQSEGEREEHLNVAIRTLSQQLVFLQIIGIFTVTPDLFISRKAQAAPGTEQQPYWPRLENLHIETINWTYNGTWYINPNMLRVVWRINDFLRSSTPDFNNLMVANVPGHSQHAQASKARYQLPLPPIQHG